MERLDIEPDRKLARTAGLLYLTMIVGTSLSYITTLNLTGGEAAVSIDNLSRGLRAFELAILGFATGLVAFLFLGLWLYRLFRPIHEFTALVLLVLVTVHSALSLAGIAPLMNALSLLRDPGLAGLAMDVQVHLSISSFYTLWRVSFIFSGLWLFPLGWLVYRCGYLPRFVGIAAMVGSASYVLAFAGWVMDPAYDQSLIGMAIGVVSGLPSLIGEMGTCISLLVVGFRRGMRVAA